MYICIYEYICLSIYLAPYLHDGKLHLSEYEKCIHVDVRLPVSTSVCRYSKYVFMHVCML